jgi:hypothetical protein
MPQEQNLASDGFPFLNSTNLFSQFSDLQQVFLCVINFVAEDRFNCHRISFRIGRIEESDLALQGIVLSADDIRNVLAKPS